MEMTPDKWERVKALFEAALQQDPSERVAFLARACPEDDLRHHIEQLLVHHQEAGNFLNDSVLDWQIPAAGQLAPSDASPEQTPFDPIVGCRVGAYQITRRIGFGGMAAVYLASRADEQYRKQVAIKILRPGLDSSELLSRFRSERQTLAGLDHPNIVKLLDGGSTDEGLPYLVMDYVEGVPIDEHCDSRRLSIEERLRLFCKVCAAVECAHRNMVVHRDLKPGNIFVTADGTPKLLDFGISKVLNPDPSSQTLLVTQTNTRRMTPAYASPEQVRGESVTASTDIYSLGVVLYELLTGHRPYKLKEHTPAEMERAIREDEPEKPSTAVDRVEVQTSSDGTSVTKTAEAVSRTREGQPEKLRRCLKGDLDTIVLTALQKEPQRRYPSVAELSQDIERHLEHQPIKARSSTLGYRTSKFVKRHKSEVIAGALMATVLLGASSFTLWKTHRAKEAALAELMSQRSRGRRSVAVLGFKNVSGRTETAWLSTALSEMLTTELAAAGKLRTISGEDVAQMKVNLSLLEADSLSSGSLGRVYKNLGSDYVVVGSYLDLGGPDKSVRLDLRLQDAALGETVASVAENGSETALPDLVARAGAILRDKLGIPRLSPTESAGFQAALPSNPEATRLYAEGLDKLRIYDALGAKDSIEKAIVADPSFALAHSVLADVWATLGYDARAKDEARKALELAANLPRQENLLIEGRYRQAAREWDKAIEIYQTLFRFFPDNLDYGLRLAEAQVAAGKQHEALRIVEELRKLAPPAGADPRLDLAESRVADSLSDYKRQANSAFQAARKGETLGARLLVAQAKLGEASALRSLGDHKGANAASEQAERLFVATGNRFGEAQALRNLGTLLVDKGDFENGKKALQKAALAFHELGNRAGEADVLGQMAVALYRQHDLEGAKQVIQQSLTISREIGDRIHQAHALNILASLEQHQGDLPHAKIHFKEALAINREIGSQSGAARVLNNLALVLMAEGDFPGARNALEECLGISRQTGNKDDIGIALLNLGDLHFNHGEAARAKKLYSEALKIFRETGNQAALSYVLYAMSDIRGNEGDLDGARKGQEEALAIREKIGAKGDAAHSRISLASIALEQGRASDAEVLAREAAAEFHAVKDKGNEADANRYLAQSLRSQGKLPEAQSAIDSAMKLSDASGDRGTQISTTIEYARIQAALGKTNEAVKLLETTIGQARKAGFVQFQFEAWLALAEVHIKSRNLAAARSQIDALQREARATGHPRVARQAAELLRKH